MQFTGFEDFREKYNPRNNPESFASWNTFGRSIGGLAELKRKGLIDIAFLDGMMMSDVMNWWIRFGALEKEAWERGDPNWWSHFPFIMEVVDYRRKQFPSGFDENGASKTAHSRGQTWVNPEYMMQLRARIMEES